MKKFLLLLHCVCFSLLSFGQINELPHWQTAEERAMARWHKFTTPGAGPENLTPPPHPVRHMAEWEELDALIITWRTPSYTNIFTEIVRHAKEEVTVLIVVRDEAEKTTVTNTLQNNDITLDNVEFVVAPNNTIWVRDYGPQFVYANNIEEPYIIDWIYNRPRPQDNAIPNAIGNFLNIPVFATTESPDDLVHTGGNFLSDGLGTGFSSKLVLEENAPGNDFNAGPHSEAAIDEMMNTYLGIDRYVKMNTLPYDEIHHIDMHMKLLDEETIMMGEYPTGVADGPTIEANLQYVLSNFNSAFGKPYKVVRILQPPKNGFYPPHPSSDYRTYTNSVFVNKTILVPTYETQYDTIALRIYRENFPGYKVVGINCNSIISSLGALHCITKEIGAADPLWIVHDRLEDIEDNNSWSGYEISATIQHKSGISGAEVYYTTDTTAAYTPLDMTLVDATTNTWSANIPHQDNGTEIFYYIHATANSLKEQVRPMVAPEGYYNFHVDDETSATEEIPSVEMKPMYPNPSNSITAVPVYSEQAIAGSIEIFDLLGNRVETVFSGILSPGLTHHFIMADQLAPGAYFVTMRTGSISFTQKLIVK